MKREIVRIEKPVIDWSGIPDQYRARFLNPGEPETLVALFRKAKPERVIEFGANNGRTAKLLMDNVPSIKQYIGVDVPSWYVFSKECQKYEVPENPGMLALKDERFELILSPRGSMGFLVKALSWCDAAFVDGDHGAMAVRSDWTIATELGCKLVVFHDDHQMRTVDVSSVLDEIHDSGVSLKHVDGTWLTYYEED
jgi:hypothetical protein